MSDNNRNGHPRTLRHLMANRSASFPVGACDPLRCRVCQHIVPREQDNKPNGSPHEHQATVIDYYLDHQLTIFKQQLLLSLEALRDYMLERLAAADNLNLNLNNNNRNGFRQCERRTACFWQHFGQVKCLQQQEMEEEVEDLRTSKSYQLRPLKENFSYILHISEEGLEYLQNGFEIQGLKVNRVEAVRHCLYERIVLQDVQQVAVVLKTHQPENTIREMKSMQGQVATLNIQIQDLEVENKTLSDKVKKIQLENQQQQLNLETSRQQVRQQNSVLGRQNDWLEQIKEHLAQKDKEIEELKEETLWMEDMKEQLEQKNLELEELKEEKFDLNEKFLDKEAEAEMLAKELYKALWETDPDSPGATASGTSYHQYEYQSDYNSDHDIEDSSSCKESESDPEIQIAWQESFLAVNASHRFRVRFLPNSHSEPGIQRPQNKHLPSHLHVIKSTKDPNKKQADKENIKKGQSKKTKETTSGTSKKTKKQRAKPKASWDNDLSAKKKNIHLAVEKKASKQGLKTPEHYQLERKDSFVPVPFTALPLPKKKKMNLPKYQRKVTNPEPFSFYNRAMEKRAHRLEAIKKLQERQAALEASFSVPAFKAKPAPKKQNKKSVLPCNSSRDSLLICGCHF